MAGSAVGLGNLWRFPYLVGENGGAAFIIIYVILSFVICLPIFISEFVIGRRSQENAYSAFRDLSGGSAWRWVGLFTIFVPMVVLSYYSVIGGWSIEYLLKSCTFSFTGGASQASINTFFTNFVTSTWGPLAVHTAFLFLTMLIVVVGETQGGTCITLAGGGEHGGPACCKIDLPAAWDALLAEYANIKPTYHNY